MHQLTDDYNNVIRIANPDSWNFCCPSDENRKIYEKKRAEYLRERNRPENILMRKIDKARNECKKCWTCFHFPSHYNHCKSCTHIAEKIK